MTNDEALAGARALRWHVWTRDVAIPLNPDSGIFAFWCANPYLLCPLAPEIAAADGTVVQAFLGGIVIYEPGQGCRVIH